jgi:hypothetical protein
MRLHGPTLVWKRTALGRGGASDGCDRPCPTRFFVFVLQLPCKSLKLLYVSIMFFKLVMTCDAPQAQGGRRKDNGPSLIEAQPWFGIRPLGQAVRRK